MALSKEDMERGNALRKALHEERVEKIRRHIAERGILDATNRLITLLHKQRNNNEDIRK